MAKTPMLKTRRPTKLYIRNRVVFFFAKLLPICGYPSLHVL